MFFGSFKFQAGEFGESLDKIEPLLTRLDQSKGQLKDIKSAIDWLNNTIEPFQQYSNHIRKNKIDEKIERLLTKDFICLSLKDLTAFAVTVKGQRMKVEVELDIKIEMGIGSRIGTGCQGYLPEGGKQKFVAELVNIYFRAH